MRLAYLTFSLSLKYLGKMTDKLALLFLSLSIDLVGWVIARNYLLKRYGESRFWKINFVLSWAMTL